MPSVRKHGGSARRAVHDRRLRLVVRRRRRRLIVAAVIMAGLVCAVLALGWASHHERLEVQEVHVEGAAVVSEEAIVRAAQAQLTPGRFELFSSANILLYPKDEITTLLYDAFPRIRRVSVSADIRGQVLTVVIEEREPHARWCHTESAPPCFVMDRGGFIFAPADGEVNAGETIQFIGGLSERESYIDSVLLPTHLDDVQELILRLSESGYETRSVRIDNEHDFTLVFDDGLELRAQFADGAERIVANLRTAFASEALRGQRSALEYIDLRFGDRVYYQFEEGEEEEVAEENNGNE